MKKAGSGTGRQFEAAFLVLLVVSGSLSIGLTIGSQPVTAAAAAGNVEGTRHLNASAPNARFDPGQSGTIDVTLSNNATDDYDDATTTATDVYLGSEGSRSYTTYVEEWLGGNGEGTLSMELEHRGTRISKRCRSRARPQIRRSIGILLISIIITYFIRRVYTTTSTFPD